MQRRRGLALRIMATGLLAVSCKERIEIAVENESDSEFFVGQPVDSEWPYRYTLIRTEGKWTGEVEFVSDGDAIFFDKMDVVSSSDDKIVFAALYGGPGKALPMGWELSLSQSGNDFDGSLVATGFVEEFKPIQLKFVSAKSAILPSSELEGKIQAMDDGRYRTKAALNHEVVVAKQEWERESKVAERISELRQDDEIRRGIRKEWVGPAWVRDKVQAEDSKYFERICSIYLGGTTVTDADVQAISDLTELRELYLYRTGITDVALDKIGHLGGLRILHLGNTEVSDSGLEKLRGLTSLEQLHLYKTRVSDEGGDKLRSALPNADIQW